MYRYPAGIAVKHLITFFGLSYLISWLIWLPLYGHILGLDNLPALPFQHGLGGFGPLIAAFITTYRYNGGNGVRILLRKFGSGRHWVYLLIALFGPFLLAVIAAVISHFITQKPVAFSGLLTVREFPEFNLIVFFLYNLLFFGLGEEAGWRGYALPALQSRYNALMAAVILTFLWALWHWPAFFYRPGYMGMGIGGIMGWLFSLLTGSVLLTWLFNATRGSVLVCAIFHATVDIAFTADFADKDIVNYMGALITVWGIVTILIFRPRNLAPHRRVMME